MDKSGGRDEADRQALLAGRQPQSKSNMGLPRAAVADRDHVLSASDVLAAGKLQHHCLVERRDHRELETVQALDRRKPRLLDAALDHPLLPVDQFELGERSKQRLTCVLAAARAAAVIFGSTALHVSADLVDSPSRSCRRRPNCKGQDCLTRGSALTQETCNRPNSFTPASNVTGMASKVGFVSASAARMTV